MPGFVWIFVLSWLPSGGEESWKTLFNGKDLDAWVRRGGEAEYRIDGAEIVGVSRTDTPNTFLCTRQAYGDFILELDVKIDPALNSGIQFRSLSVADYQKGRVHGYQAEVDPSQRRYSGGIYDEGRRGWLCPLAENEKGRGAFRNGEWNSYRIEAIGHSLRVWVNGILTANLEDDQTPEGFIGLQVHSIGRPEHAGKEVRFRELRILTDDLEAARWPIDRAVVELNLVANTLTELERRTGWRLLFDGRTVDAWRSAGSDEFPGKGWVVDQGMLTVLSTGGGESEGGGDIITRDKFGEFEFKAEFKITKGANSGIKYFVDPELNKSVGSAIGLEYQILDDSSHEDAKLGVNGNRTLASLYDLIPATNLSLDGGAKVMREIGAWNQARIVVRGNHVEHWLNGFKVVEYERGTPMYRALVACSKYKVFPRFGELTEGHILLQDHGHEVSFRSIKVREF